MRICAIRGRNLASLAGEFEVDLEAEPLAGAGLFAITGPTGAGKSTILDALCLALFGDFPRIRGKGDSIKIEDAGGEDISSTEARSILRRDSADGWAEADIVAGGERLRARWSVKRARGKLDGKLQPPTHTLVRMPDGAPLASGQKEARAEIARRIGLSFEQFGRTVLLAQGEFDAFLRADDRDRSELLQRITGTDVYSRTSAAVHVLKRDCEQAVAALESQIAALGPQQDASPDSLEQRLRQLGAGRAAAVDARTAARGEVEAHRALALATAAEVEAGERLAVARVALEAQAGTAERLESLARLDRVRPILEAAALAEQARQTRAAELAERETEASAAEAALRTATEALERARAGSDVAEAAEQEAAPRLAGAEALDKRIEAATMALGDLTQRLETAGRVHALALTAHEEASRKSRELAAASAGLPRELEADEPIRRVAERLDDIRRQLGRHAGARAEQDAARAVQARAQSAHAAALSRLGAARAEADTLAGRHGALAKALLPREQALAQIDVAGLADRQQRLSAAGAILAERVQTLGRRETASAALAEADALSARAERLATESDDRRQSAEHRLVVLRARRTETGSAAAQASLAHGQAAAHLRAQLVPGEPCPVCGAREHPGHGAGALDALVATLKDRLVRLDREIADGEAARDEAQAALAAATGEARSAGLAIDRYRQEIAACDSRLSERAGQLATAVAALGWRSTEPGLAALRERLTEVEIRSGEVAESLQQAHRLQAEIGRERNTLARLADALAAGLDGLARLEAEVASADRDLALADRATAEAERRLAAPRQELATLLAGTDVGLVDLDRDAGSLTRHLEASIGHWRERVTRHARAVALLAEAEKVLAGTAAGLAAAASAREAVAGEHAGLAGDLDALRRSHSGLLGGEPTVRVRTRLAEARERALDAVRGAEAAEASARHRLDLLIATVARARSALETAGRDSAARASDRAAALAGARLDEATVVELTAVSAEAREALSRDHVAATAAVTRAEALLADRRAARAAVVGDFPPARAHPEAESALAAAEAAVAALDQQLGSLRGEIARAAEARRTLAGLEAELAARRHDLDVHRAVDAAIGSADGAKFRRFAQSITLDHLVELANGQLRGLAPRYRLERARGTDLGLQVRDEEMAGEARSTRSLSGGERFLVSLALALALASLDGRAAFVDTLFIDEGFGSLDARSLDLAVEALESLQSRGRKVGVISHVEAMNERIPVQVRVERRGAGRSVVRVVDRSQPLARAG